MGYLKKITLLAVVVFLIAFFLVPVMSWLRSSPIERHPHSYPARYESE